MSEPTPEEIAALRRDYMLRGLSESDLNPDPFRQFAIWFQEALNSQAVAEPNAMVLSTVANGNQPRGRIVLLKGFSDQGFVFFTNCSSAKGHELAANPLAALTLGWVPLERQVCIEGRTSLLPQAAADAYFQTRPRGSQLGAWASHQSEIITSREVLEKNLAEVEARFPGDIPRPPEWGGYLLVPERIEFWQGRTNRLHDRLRYRRDGKTWLVERLSP